MKFRLQHMAVVAAAAVVGPTVLMATPAMANEVQNPAVTTPDAEPKDDTAPESGEPVTQPEAGQPEAGQPAPEPGQPEAGQPEAGQPQAPKDETKPGAAEEQNAAQAPSMTLTGLPQEFKAGSDWREFSLHVDNSGRAKADDYSLELALWTLDTLAWEAEDIQTEVYAPNAAGTWGWQKIEAYGSEEAYSFAVADVDIEANEVFDLKLRMKFAKDTPASKFSLSTTAEGGSADRVRYLSKVTAAPKSDHEGPKVALKGLPEAGLTAGGAWQPLTLNVDNTGNEAFDRYGFRVLFFNSGDSLKAKQVEFEVWDGANWVGVENNPANHGFVMDFERAVGKDAKFDIQLRVKIAPDAPLGEAILVIDASYDDDIMSNLIYVETSIHAPGTDPGTNPGGGGESGGDTGNQPKPDGGAAPIVDQGAGTTAGTGGQLAATGSDPATTWALGGAGVALAMGAALVAGTGKRRRPTA
ncbi:hypothetical protein OG625_10660 [Streptomyces sp. NBC_01351]|uniref:hypothetical protein n=1 Tax=Streptomyces sp. NBC_01351 TaxID=2903833 RepID=UPI002E37945C|nr:hypothetical protein [Streptomyces sp. NBC_01351]